ncbi:hypothetical protein BT69DRAFT_979629 [Atractiella rhizophila]|nr:hypothetical protein BT69DRAFT_979629 [Atractiella rhizophila]
MVVPALKGDGQGRYRVVILGNCGVGKSTLGDRLATILDLPILHLDEFFWLPGWNHRSNDEFKEKVLEVTRKSERGWIVDGNYQARIGTVLEDESTDVIWLDPPLLLYFPRILMRTLRRILRITPPCKEGCTESIPMVLFSSRSILYWSFARHWEVRKTEGDKLMLDGVEVGGKRRRIGGWGAEYRAWMHEVERIQRVA